MVFASHLFPPHAIDPTYIEKAQQASHDAAPVVRNTLLERSDAVRRMLNSRTRTT
jgi:aminopeptidase N